MGAGLSKIYQIGDDEVQGMEVLSQPGEEGIELMMNLMHLIEEGVRVEQPMAPIEEEIFDEVDDENLRGQLQEAGEIIKSHPNSTEIRQIDCQWVDQQLIHEQILDRPSHHLRPILSFPRSAGFFIDEVLGIVAAPSHIPRKVYEKADNLEDEVAGKSPNEDKVCLVLYSLWPVMLPYSHTDPHQAEKQGYAYGSIDEAFLLVSLLLDGDEPLQLVHAHIINLQR